LASKSCSGGADIETRKLFPCFFGVPDRSRAEPFKAEGAFRSVLSEGECDNEKRVDLDVEPNPALRDLAGKLLDKEYEVLRLRAAPGFSDTDTLPLVLFLLLLPLLFCRLEALPVTLVPVLNGGSFVDSESLGIMTNLSSGTASSSSWRLPSPISA
jgi:hypothetical protein